MWRSRSKGRSRPPWEPTSYSHRVLPFSLPRRAASHRCSNASTVVIVVFVGRREVVCGAPAVRTRVRRRNVRANAVYALRLWWRAQDARKAHEARALPCAEQARPRRAHAASNPSTMCPPLRLPLHHRASRLPRVWVCFCGERLRWGKRAGLLGYEVRRRGGGSFRTFWIHGAGILYSNRPHVRPLENCQKENPKTLT